MVRSRVGPESTDEVERYQVETMNRDARHRSLLLLHRNSTRAGRSSSISGQTGHVGLGGSCCYSPDYADVKDENVHARWTSFASAARGTAGVLAYSRWQAVMEAAAAAISLGFSRLCMLLRGLSFLGSQPKI